jgi:hypothetical protein
MDMVLSRLGKHCDRLQGSIYSRAHSCSTLMQQSLSLVSHGLFGLFHCISGIFISICRTVRYINNPPGLGTGATWNQPAFNNVGINAMS